MYSKENNRSVIGYICLKNSNQLIEHIYKLKNITNIVTYDFKDLFNNINLNDLNKIINDLFKDYFTQLQLPNNISIDYFRTLTNFIINNNYIMQNSLIYHQESGIAQGGCSSSMLADLFLYYYEKTFTNNNNLHFFRYIDDIIIFSTDYTQCELPVTYPSYLSLTKNILTNNSINFLDLKIILKNKLLSIDIYDKRKDFNFKVNMFTNFNSCMHLSVYRNILLNHLFRIKKLSSTQFKNHNIKKLIYDALEHEYPNRFI